MESGTEVSQLENKMVAWRKIFSLKLTFEQRFRFHSKSSHGRSWWQSVPTAAQAAVFYWKKFCNVLVIDECCRQDWFDVNSELFFKELLTLANFQSAVFSMLVSVKIWWLHRNCWQHCSTNNQLSVVRLALLAPDWGLGLIWWIKKRRFRNSRKVFVG